MPFTQFSDRTNVTSSPQATLPATRTSYTYHQINDASWHVQPGKNICYHLACAPLTSLQASTEEALLAPGGTPVETNRFIGAGYAPMSVLFEANVIHVSDVELSLSCEELWTSPGTAMNVSDLSLPPCDYRHHAPRERRAPRTKDIGFTKKKGYDAWPKGSESLRPLSLLRYVVPENSSSKGERISTPLIHTGFS